MNPYHFREVLRNKKNGHIDLWLKAMKAKFDGIGKPFQGEDFDQMLWNYDSVSDTPACLFVEELVAAYPEAKVILTVRSPESWLRSMQNTLIRVISWRSWTVLSLLDHEHSAVYWPLFNRIMRVMTKGQVPWKSSAFPSLLEFFNEHNDLVRRVVPKDRLLEFHPSQGWGPMCEFLDLPVPAKKFPHVSEAENNVKAHKSMYWNRWWEMAKQGANTVGLIGLILGVILYMRSDSVAGYFRGSPRYASGPMTRVLHNK